MGIPINAMMLAGLKRGFLLVEKFYLYLGNAVGAAAEASKIISFLPNLITETRVRNRVRNK